MNCPCNPQTPYKECCQPFHKGELPHSAEQLMRSRYSAFVLGEIDYIINTTVPAQQKLLDKQDIAEWSQKTNWQKLTVHEHIPKIRKRHAQVNFEAFFTTNEGIDSHCELSTFVTINNRWYFIDPMHIAITKKQSCICESGQKFKNCCGIFQ